MTTTVSEMMTYLETGIIPKHRAVKESQKKAKKTEEQFDQEWTQKYGLKGATIIRRAVDENMATYKYLKQFRFPPKAALSIISASSSPPFSCPYLNKYNK